jgi:hypothetical protein
MGGVSCEMKSGSSECTGWTREEGGFTRGTGGREYGHLDRVRC